MAQHTDEQLNAPADLLGPPESVRRLVDLRVASFTSDTRRLVGALAVLGGSAGIADAASLAGLTAPFAAVDEAVAAGVLEVLDEVDGTQIRFHHALHRLVVYQGLPLEERAGLHRLAAAARPAPTKRCAARDRRRVRPRSAARHPGRRPRPASLGDGSVRRRRQLVPHRRPPEGRGGRRRTHALVRSGMPPRLRRCGRGHQRGGRDGGGGAADAAAPVGPGRAGLALRSSCRSEGPPRGGVEPARLAITPTSPIVPREARPARPGQQPHGRTPPLGRPHGWAGRSGEHGGRRPVRPRRLQPLACPRPRRRVRQPGLVGRARPGWARRQDARQGRPSRPAPVVRRPRRRRRRRPPDPRRRPRA